MLLWYTHALLVYGKERYQLNKSKDIEVFIVFNIISLHIAMTA